MKAITIIKKLLADSRLCEWSGIMEYYNDDKGNTNYLLFDSAFGEWVNILGKPKDNTTYLWQYSDTCETTYDKMPDVIVILTDGRCVFLYAIE